MRAVLRLWLVVVPLLLGITTSADEAAGAEVQSDASELGARGKPEIVLDRLDFPETVRGWWTYKKYLRRLLKKQVRRVIWGAGTGDRIEYRFEITTLDISEKNGVLTVSCRATGRLPKGKKAVGKLSFSGDPKRRHALIKQVLEIVSRGVITRLAELERIRRGRN